MRQLNVGSGSDYREGYTNIDRYRLTPEQEQDPQEPDILADAHALPFADDSFERVLMRHTLEHLRRPYDAITDAHRVLISDGLIYVEVPDATKVEKERRDHLYSWTPWTFRTIIREAGFSIEGHQGAGDVQGITGRPR